MHAPNLEDSIGQYVEEGQIAGATMLSWRDGTVDAACVGWRDLERRLPVKRDTIFRIASMTKPITAVLALMLHEEGRFALDDAISDWVSEFTHMRVLRSAEGSLDETFPAQRQITFDDLLTHRSGLTYGSLHTCPIAAAYADALGRDIDSHLSPDEWIARLATLPLIDHPGRGFHYGNSSDLLGLIIERIAGSPLDLVMKERIFTPLGMKNTGFVVPRGKRDARAGLHGFDADGRVRTLPSVPGGHALNERTEDMTFYSGGQGLWSTVDDYLAFARLLVGDETVTGNRLLLRDTLSLMSTNRLTTTQRANARLLGQPIFAKGHGYGMGVAVVMEPEHAEPSLCGGGLRAFGWPGAYGGWWRVDPSDRSIKIFLTHNMVEMEQLAAGIGIGVYEAIQRFAAT